MLIQSLNEWFETPLGGYLLAREQEHFDHAVADVFGFNALQIGLPQHDFLGQNRIALRFSAGLEAGVRLRADPGHLPIESNSIDLAVLPHVLEFSPNPHEILREVGRALMPEGQIMICGFNPRSLWGLRRILDSERRSYPWCGRFISLPRLKDWLALLDFEVTGGRLDCYVPPFRQDDWRGRFTFLEKAGDRWWPIAGGVYFVQAVKRVHGMRVIKPNWNDVRAARKSLAPLTQKLNGKDSRLAARARAQEAKPQ
ncbi:MAG: methyltransferase domain-containing protein [Betaproteobacteria bacterium]|nr:methyltransferase domain-containing protein [Betaproteobacteria bacterium]